jgi:neutral ceramidase
MTTARSLPGLLVVAAALLGSSITGPTAGAAQPGGLRAGAAKADITPTKDLFPLDAGQKYGSVHDPLFARALVLDNGTAKVALISVDVTSLARGDELIAAVTRELGIPRERLILNATHNHNAPTGPIAGQGTAPGPAPYFEILKNGIVAAARQANANLQPARIGFGRGKAYVNTNRDEKIGAGYHMGYVPDGPSDKTVAVVAVTTPAGAPLAVYANYAVHGVVMYRTHTLDGHIQITGDLPGATSSYVEQRLGNRAVALWTSGAAGDQNPLFMANYNQDAPDVFDEGPAGWGILDVQARRLGEEIVRVTKGIQNTSDRAVLWGAATSVTCPGQQRAEPPQPGVPQQGYAAPATVKMKDADPVTIPLALLMVNDIALAGVSGEVFTEIGERLKRESIFDRTVMVTVLANGIGYIPTDKAYLMPSEKAIINRLKPGCAEPALIGAFQQLMQQYLPVWNAAR